MKSDNENVQRWLDSQDFQNFLRQVHVDVYVGLKNGVARKEIVDALKELCRCIKGSIDLGPVDFEDLVDHGQWLDFYGVCDTCFKLNNEVFEAEEDPDDGYRSYLKTVKPVTTSNLTFSHIPFAKVQVLSNSEGYELADANGHVWLTIGTDRRDDYYPCFVFRYTPPKQ